MKLYLIGLLITLVISGYLAYLFGKGRGIDTMIAGTMFIWLILFCCSLMSYQVLLSFCEQKRLENIELDRIEIVALSNYNALKGNYFLAAGNINSEPSYAYYYKTPDGGIRIGTEDARYITVFEEDIDDAYKLLVGTKIIYHKPTNLLVKIFIPAFLIQEEKICWTRWTIHVPRGTIVRKVKLDLKDLN